MLICDIELKFADFLSACIAHEQLADLASVAPVTAEVVIWIDSDQGRMHACAVYGWSVLDNASCWMTECGRACRRRCDVHYTSVIGCSYTLTTYVSSQPQIDMRPSRDEMGCVGSPWTTLIT